MDIRSFDRSLWLRVDINCVATAACRSDFEECVCARQFQRPMLIFSVISLLPNFSQHYILLIMRFIGRGQQVLDSRKSRGCNIDLGHNGDKDSKSMQGLSKLGLHSELV